MNKETETERPRIGDFARPTDPRKGRQAKAAEAQEAKAPPESKDKEPEVDEKFVPPKTDAEANAEGRISLLEEMQDALVPVTDYKKFLKEQKVDEVEAAQIVDDILIKGFYEEEILLTKNFSIVLRTRTQQDIIRLQTAMQVQRPLYQDTMNELIIRYNMASSLLRYGDKTFEFPPDTASVEEADKFFDVRLTFIEKLPSAIFQKLSIKMAKFDQKIAVVMREGVAENF